MAAQHFNQGHAGGRRDKIENPYTTPHRLAEEALYEDVIRRISSIFGPAHGSWVFGFTGSVVRSSEATRR